MNTKYTKDSIEFAVKNSETITETLTNLNLKKGSFEHLKKYIKQYNIDTSHFNPNKKRIKTLKERSNSIKIPLHEILVENSSYNRTRLKNRLYKEGLKKKNCELCGQDESWHGKKMSLILDHINGIWNDNRIQNLRIVCPNCNATLDTHAGKNIKKKIKVDKRKLNRKVERPPYEQLKTEIRKLGYVGTGKKYGVSDNAIRKWENFYRKFQP